MLIWLVLEVGIETRDREKRILLAGDTCIAVAAGLNTLRHEGPCKRLGRWNCFSLSAAFSGSGGMGEKPKRASGLDIDVYLKLYQVAPE